MHNSKRTINTAHHHHFGGLLHNHSYQIAPLFLLELVKHCSFSSVASLQVEFERAVATEDGEEAAAEATGKVVKRVLFTRHNAYPQKKVLTFPKHRKDFEVRVNYGDVSFLDDAQKQLFGEKSLFTVNLKGVDKAIEKHDAENVETKGKDWC